MFKFEEGKIIASFTKGSNVWVIKSKLGIENVVITDTRCYKRVNHCWCDFYCVRDKSVAYLMRREPSYYA